MKEVKTRGFSQFPVYKSGAFFGLLTENGITNWLSNNLNDDIFILSETKVEDVIHYEEQENTFLFVSRNISIYEAKKYFIDPLRHGSVKLHALLFTEHGNPNEKLLGIITPWDVMDL